MWIRVAKETTVRKQSEIGRQNNYGRSERKSSSLGNPRQRNETKRESHLYIQLSIYLDEQNRYSLLTQDAGTGREAGSTALSYKKKGWI